MLVFQLALFGVLCFSSLAVQIIPSAQLVATRPTALTDSNIQDFVDKYTSGAKGFSPISDWDVSAVKDMSHLFKGKALFNESLSKWNTARVTSMKGMFAYASSFNMSLDGWNTSLVSSMSNMFFKANNFNQPLRTWNTEAVTDMSGMFMFAYYFNMDINSWNTGRVTDMHSMFEHSGFFNQPLDKWSTGQVTTMELMFEDAKHFNQPISTWDTKRVATMAEMFHRSRDFNRAVGNWNTAGVTSMRSMFQEAEYFNKPVNAWNMGQVKDTSRMFKRAYRFNQPLNMWKMEQVHNTSEMFVLAVAFIQSLDNWTVQGAVDGKNMFSGTSHSTTMPFETKPQRDRQEPLDANPQEVSQQTMVVSKPQPEINDSQRTRPITRPTLSPMRAPIAKPTPALKPEPMPFEAVSPIANPTDKSEGLGSFAHMVNIKGEPFTVWRLGEVDLLRMPRHMMDRTQIRVSAKISNEKGTLSGSSCSKVPYVTAMRFSGAWFGDQELFIRMIDGEMRVHVGTKSLLPLEKVVLQHGMVVSRPVEPYVQVSAANATIKVIHDAFFNPHLYLNIEARNLGSLGFEIGGILGLDDHTVPAQKPPGCEKQLVSVLPNVRGSLASASLYD